VLMKFGGKMPGNDDSINRDIKQFRDWLNRIDGDINDLKKAKIDSNTLETRLKRIEGNLTGLANDVKDLKKKK